MLSPVEGECDLAMSSQDVSPVFVSSEAAEAVFDWPSAIAALQDAYSRPDEPRAAPPRSIAAAATPGCAAFRLCRRAGGTSAPSSWAWRRARPIRPASMSSSCSTESGAGLPASSMVRR